MIIGCREWSREQNHGWLSVSCFGILRVRTDRGCAGNPLGEMGKMEEKQILRAGNWVCMGVDSNWKFSFELLDLEMLRHKKGGFQEPGWYTKVKFSEGGRVGDMNLKVFCMEMIFRFTWMEQIIWQRVQRRNRRISYILIYTNMQVL